jgi:hypothetical protein
MALTSVLQPADIADDRTEKTNGTFAAYENHHENKTSTSP